MSDPKHENAQNDETKSEVAVPSTVPFFGGTNVTKPAIRTGVRAGARAEEKRKRG